MVSATPPTRGGRGGDLADPPDPLALKMHYQQLVKLINGRLPTPELDDKQREVRKTYEHAKNALASARGIAAGMTLLTLLASGSLSAKVTEDAPGLLVPAFVTSMLVTGIALVLTHYFLRTFVEDSERMFAENGGASDPGRMASGFQKAGMTMRVISYILAAITIALFALAVWWP